MGLNTWLMKRGIKNITQAMCTCYKDAKSVNPDMDEAELCQSMVSVRYAAVAPSPQEMAIISQGIGFVTDMYMACFLVFQAETGITSANSPKLVEKARDIIFEEVGRYL